MNETGGTGFQFSVFLNRAQYFSHSRCLRISYLKFAGRTAGSARVRNRWKLGPGTGEIPEQEGIQESTDRWNPHTKTGPALHCGKFQHPRPRHSVANNLQVRGTTQIPFLGPEPNWSTWLKCDRPWVPPLGGKCPTQNTANPARIRTRPTETVASSKAFKAVRERFPGIKPFGRSQRFSHETGGLTAQTGLMKVSAMNSPNLAYTGRSKALAKRLAISGGQTRTPACLGATPPWFRGITQKSTTCKFVPSQTFPATPKT